MQRTTVAYGDHPEQFGHFYLPDAPAPDGPTRLVALVHGGSWHADNPLLHVTPFARHFADQGVAVWNIEYRRIGAGGRWPEIAEDVVTAWNTIGTDLTARAAEQGIELQVDDVRLAGHSAGGQIAGWLAGEPLAHRPSLFVSIAGTLDIASPEMVASRGDGALTALFGVPFSADPERYRQASPLHRLPLGIPTLVIHGDADELVPLDIAQRYVAAAQAAGDPATLDIIPGEGHFAFLDPQSATWAHAARALTAKTPENALDGG